MVKMIPDKTGRFAERPFFTERELDSDCERLIRELLQKRYGKIEYPVMTDDLTVLIENHDAELDCYADLRTYGDDVEGVTEFFPDKGPKVSISEQISGDDRRENRYRTTLTHEFGHVKFHGPLWAEKFATGDLLDRRPHANKAVSKRDNILSEPSATLMTMPWLNALSGFSKPRSSTRSARGNRCATSNGEPSNGSIGITIAGCSVPSATSHPLKQRWRSMQT